MWRYYASIYKNSSLGEPGQRLTACLHAQAAPRGFACIPSPARPPCICPTLTLVT